MSEESMLSNETTEQAQEAPVTQPQETQSTDWRSSLDESLRSAPSLESIKDINSLAKSYVEAQSMLGKSIRIPSNDAGDEARAAFLEKLKGVPGVVAIPSDPSDKKAMEALYNKLGRPEEASKYELKFDEKIQGLIDKDSVEGFKQLAYEAGLSQAQVQKLAEFEQRRTMEFAEAQQASLSAGKAAIKQAWGDTMDSKLAAAQHVFGEYANKFGQEHAQALEAAAGNNPILLAALADLANKQTEANAHSETSRPSFEAGPMEAKERIQEMRNNPETRQILLNQTDPRHKEVKAKLDHYYRIAYPSKQ